MNLAPLFKPQFFNDDGTPMVGGKLWSYASGTNTPLSTYEDEAGTTLNMNPIILDARGECDLWLTPDSAYRLTLLRADDTEVWVKDDVSGAAGSGDIVTSVNDLTGAVDLTAAEIPFTTATSTTWFEGTDTSAALDALITRADSGQTAASVSIADSGSYFTGTSVEAALQELGARSNSGLFLRRTVFASTGTWTKGTGCNVVDVQGVGGGGGSAAAGAGGGGGGGGGYFRKRINAPGSTESVTIGTGGAVSTAGGTTSFGSHASASGGSPGVTIAGGAGGSGSGGDVNFTGGGGGGGGSIDSSSIFGSGGSSFFGGGAPGDINNSSGKAGVTGSGGGGSGGTATGGNGGSGLVYVDEYT
jgi:hypothetical protein